MEENRKGIFILFTFGRFKQLPLKKSVIMLHEQHYQIFRV